MKGERMHAGRAGRALVALAGVVLFGSGCYHAVIETGRPQSGTMIEKKWAHGFLWGLVPPTPVATASQCTNGVAKVETQHSFLNSLASGLTWGIYTPITIQVWCAGPGSPDEEWN
ncbi:MAG: Bor family protein, partial [Longimicrobiales bacterium]